MQGVNPRLEWVPAVLLIISVIALPGCSGAARDGNTALAASVAPDAELESIRTATARFRDVNVAVKEGYVRDPMNHCFVAPFEGYPKQLGAMGIHYFRPDLLGVTETTLPINGAGTHTDFTQPGILLYEPQEDGRLELVAIENLVFADAWHRREKARPAFRGNEFYRMIDNPATTDVNEAHMFMPHYELHMWLYRDNPNWMSAQFNPNVTCEHHREANPSSRRDRRRRQHSAAFPVSQASSPKHPMSPPLQPLSVLPSHASRDDVHQVVSAPVGASPPPTYRREAYKAKARITPGLCSHGSRSYAAAICVSALGP